MRRLVSVHLPRKLFAGNQNFLIQEARRHCPIRRAGSCRPVVCRGPRGFGRRPGAPAGWPSASATTFVTKPNRSPMHGTAWRSLLDDVIEDRQLDTW